MKQSVDTRPSHYTHTCRKLSAVLQHPPCGPLLQATCCVPHSVHLQQMTPGFITSSGGGVKVPLLYRYSANNDFSWCVFVHLCVWHWEGERRTALQKYISTVYHQHVALEQASLYWQMKHFQQSGTNYYNFFRVAMFFLWFGIYNNNNYRLYRSL